LIVFALFVSACTAQTGPWNGTFTISACTDGDSPRFGCGNDCAVGMKVVFNESGTNISITVSGSPQKFLLHQVSTHMAYGNMGVPTWYATACLLGEQYAQGLFLFEGHATCVVDLDRIS